MANMVELIQLQKHFAVSNGLFRQSRRTVKAVDNISFSVEEGEIVGIVGESGSGKTTLARVMLSLTKMTGGNVIIDGVDLSKATKKDMEKLHREIAVVFQDPASNLNPRETLESSIMRPMVIHGVPRTKAREKAREVMEMVKMDLRYLDSFPHQLSGGQLQRIAIARALALSPKIMILDEPTSALDVSVQAQILNLLLDLREQMNLTYMIITHDLNVIRYVSSKMAVMYLGQLIEFGDTETICDRPAHPYTKGLMDAAPILDPADRGREKEIMKGDPGSLIDLEIGCRFYARCKYATPECKERDPENRIIEDWHQVACIHPLKYSS